MNRDATKEEVIAEMQAVIDAMQLDEEMTVMMLVMKDKGEATAIRIITARADNDELKRMVSVTNEFLNDDDWRTYQPRAH